MQWTILWFQNQQEEWKRRAQMSERENCPGHAAYAYKQVTMWEGFIIKASEKFKDKWYHVEK
jgi:hypothetical protein